MTTKQRAALRAMANTMEPVLHIGKEGISDNLAKQAWDALEARELIKVTVQKTPPLRQRRPVWSCASASTRNRCRSSEIASASIGRRARTPRSAWRTSGKPTLKRRVCGEIYAF